MQKRKEKKRKSFLCNKKRGNIFNYQEDHSNDVLDFIWNYNWLGESKVWQYFTYMGDNSTAPEAFTEIILDSENLSSLDTLSDCNHWICLYGLEHGLRINAFIPIWPYLIVDVLAAQAKFLETLGYYPGITCSFTFCSTNVLVAFAALWFSLNK